MLTKTLLPVYPSFPTHTYFIFSRQWSLLFNITFIFHNTLLFIIKLVMTEDVEKTSECFPSILFGERNEHKAFNKSKVTKH